MKQKIQITNQKMQIINQKIQIIKYMGENVKTSSLPSSQIKYSLSPKHMIDDKRLIQKLITQFFHFPLNSAYH